MMIVNYQPLCGYRQMNSMMGSLPRLGLREKCIATRFKGEYIGGSQESRFCRQASSSADDVQRLAFRTVAVTMMYVISRL